MPRALAPYFSALRTQLLDLTHFRANAVAWLVYSPLQLGIVYLLWKIVYGQVNRVGEFTFEAMIGYYLVVHFLRKVIEPCQTVNYEVWQEINEGRLDVYLVRPVSFGLFTFSTSLGVPVVELLVGVPFLIVFSLLFGVPLPREPWIALAFLASAAAGYVILFLVQFLIGTMTFWFERIFGVRDMIFTLFMIFSGQLIPVSVLPSWVRAASRFLPFESIYFVPAQIYSTAPSPTQVLALLGQQAIWAGGLLLVTTFAWSRGVSRYASQGG